MKIVQIQSFTIIKTVPMQTTPINYPTIKNASGNLPKENDTDEWCLN